MDILVIDDEKSIRDATIIALEAEDHYAEAVDSGDVALLRMKEEAFDMAFLDLRLGDEDGLDVLKEIRKRFPQVAVVVFTAYATVDTAVKAIQLGALDYLEKPFTPDQLRGLLARAEKQRRMSDRIEELEITVSNQSPDPRFESTDPAMQEIYNVLFRAAATPASILILGESGTGKSVVARAIHERSHLSSKPFVTVHCPSLSKELLESELFGHVKGSFTGAVKDKWGKVHAANGGTLFLDEIGELPLDIQPKLLRLLQEREYERVGENKTRQADVRIIAATNRNLKQDVKDGEFREDLYYRLNVITAEMPPLRSRPEDLSKFAEEFFEFFTKQTGRKISGFSKSAEARLMGYSWPGNVRELRNALERAVILATGDQIQPEDLPAPTGSVNGDSDDSDGLHIGADATLEELEEEHLRRVLSRTSSLQEAATVLGIDQATLYRKRKKLGLK
ncbi:MAG: sigma-54-dependent Fis family transcriptional regulator [Verrucomicrobiales bacterium]|nr:sigma-54-dependent Fis family transcriptional regulator [Verrucomicrobiales bacterium]